MTNSAISPETIGAYRRASYLVHATPPWILRVGTASAELQAAHASRGVACSAFVTACNPFGHVLGESENAKRQRALEDAVRDLGLEWIGGEGQDPRGCWPGEASCLIFGLNRAAAQAFARRFEQNALLWSGADGVPELVLLR